MKENDDCLNTRQRRFVEFYTSGMAAGRAYEAAGYSARGHSADVAASKLLTNIDIEDAVKEAKRVLSEANRWEKWQLLDMLQEVLEKPVGQVNEHSRIAHEVTKDEVAGGSAGQLKRGQEDSGNEVVTPEVMRTRVKMFPKHVAAKMMAEMMGWNAPKELEVDGVAELAKTLASMRNTQGYRE